MSDPSAHETLTPVTRLVTRPERELQELSAAWALFQDVVHNQQALPYMLVRGHGCVDVVFRPLITNQCALVVKPGKSGGLTGLARHETIVSITGKLDKSLTLGEAAKLESVAPFITEYWVSSQDFMHAPKGKRHADGGPRQAILSRPEFNLRATNSIYRAGVMTSQANLLQTAIIAPSADEVLTPPQTDGPLEDQQRSVGLIALG